MLASRTCDVRVVMQADRLPAANAPVTGWIRDGGTLADGATLSAATFVGTHESGSSEGTEVEDRQVHGDDDETDDPADHDDHDWLDERQHAFDG